MQKKGLEERLAACGNGADNVYPAVCWIDTVCYFYALSDMRGDFYYSTIYNCMASDERYGDVSDSFVAEILAWAYRGELPEPISDEVIYRILIEPFCDTNITWKKGGKRT